MITRLKDKLSNPGINFVALRKMAAVVSTILVVGSWVLFATVGLNWGIDFTGGTELKLGFGDEVTISDVRSALTSIGMSDEAVQQVSGGEMNEFDIRVQDASFGAERIQSDISTRLIATFGDDWIQSQRFDAEVGARMSVLYSGDPVTPEAVEEALHDLNGVVVEPGREINEVVVKMPGLAQVIQDTLKEAMGEHSFEILSIDAVGPKVGGDLRRQGMLAILATLALVILYVGFRFDVAFAPGAILALVHDVSITIGIFVLLQREVNLPMIGALLTIVGYSLNDTIVIYDRIRENMDRYARTELPELINTSINETLSRTLATSVTTMLAMVAFLFMGGPVIQNFALAMMIGIVFGTYSTVYVASPMILAMQDARPYLSKLIAGSVVETEDEFDEDEDESTLTESEKRRRARAALARDGDAS